MELIMTKRFDYYRAGQINDAGPVLYMFRFYTVDGHFGSCQLVEDHNVTPERNALIAMGWTFTREEAIPQLV
jgi:hypothetical protein